MGYIDDLNNRPKPKSLIADFLDRKNDIRIQMQMARDALTYTEKLALYRAEREAEEKHRR